MEKSNLQKEHNPANISKRLNKSQNHSYLGDSILGAIDGTVTTFAIISGVSGAGLRAEIAIILGLANLLGDGFSMAVSNFLKARSDQENVDKTRKMEEIHIEKIPEGEREEVRQIYKQKGFNGNVLDEIVSTITNNPKLWVNTMLTEEHRLSLEQPNPYKSAIYTFISFCIAGLIPLIPFMIMLFVNDLNVFLLSSIFTAIGFFVIGIIKGAILQKGKLFSGLQTLAIGYGAAILAYLIGLLTKGLVNGAGI